MIECKQSNDISILNHFGKQEKFMDENTLGKNIQYMRKTYGEKLEELGLIVNMTKSAVNDYESGRRKPNPETLEMIAKHYGKTVDEMLNIKLYEVERFDSKELIDLDNIFEKFTLILPLAESRDAYENDSFLKGMTAVKEMLNAIRKGEGVKGIVISDAMEYFIEALEVDVYEAGANVLWCIFFLWLQQYSDLEVILKFQSRLKSKQVDWKELIYETQKNEKKVSKKKQAFIEYFNELLCELIRMLKEMEQWAQLGDYYLALRYVLGMVDTGYSKEMNRVTGMQMMTAFAQLGNRYALDYLEVGADEK